MQQTVGLVGVRREQGDAHGCRHGKLLAVKGDGRMDEAQRRLCGGCRFITIVQATFQNCKLVAAQACNGEAAAAQLAGKAVGDGLQQQITGSETALLVQGLEVVDAQNRQRQLGLLTAGLIDAAL